MWFSGFQETDHTRTVYIALIPFRLDKNIKCIYICTCRISGAFMCAHVYVVFFTINTEITQSYLKFFLCVRNMQIVALKLSELALSLFLSLNHHSDEHRKLFFFLTTQKSPTYPHLFTSPWCPKVATLI